MERVLNIRRPPEQSQNGLSRASKIFLGCDIFQVVAVVVFQGLMIALGDFSAYNNTEHPGMGPGRRIYMAIYMGAVVYTCFLCLFAVKRQNFMEIIAFDLQNFAFVTYSFIQLYHVRFKTYNGLRTSKNDALPKIVLANASALLLLNVVFTYLSYKLYMEFGWKIYKRVRFNIRLRGIYQIYEVLSCLLKMEVLYWGMFAIVHSLVLLRDSHNILYVMSMIFIPLTFIYAGIGYYAVRHENRALMLFFLTWTLGGIGYFLYKLYGFVTRTCNGCPEFEIDGKDIPDEAFMHFVYLGAMNLVVASTIFGVAVKAYRNFGGGLAQHFRQKKKPQMKYSARLSLGRASHCYPEESVISVTSYDSAIDEFAESVRLDRGILRAAHAALPLLAGNGHLRVDQRSCSLPNLLSDSTPRPTSFPGPSEGGMNLLRDRLQSEQGETDIEKLNSANLESIAEEEPAGNLDSYDYGRKKGSDEIYLQDSGASVDSSFIQISRNGDFTSRDPNSNGRVSNAGKLSEHRQNGRVRKTPIEPMDENITNGCGLQSANNHEDTIADDFAQDSSMEFRTEKSSHQNAQIYQRIARLPEGVV